MPVAALAVVLAAGSGNVVAQRAVAKDPQPTFRSKVELVVLQVTVTDSDERPITGLERDDFVVVEDGVSQQLSHFLSSDVPLDVALLVDTSSSMRPILSKLRSSVTAFLRHLRPGDRGLLASFNDRTRILANLTGDGTELRGAVTRLESRGDTSLYDGLYITLQTLASASSDLTRRQALVLFSDGNDTGSNLGIDDVRRKALESGVPIYPMLFIDTHPVAVFQRNQRFEQPEIVTLARETGGRVYRLDDTTNFERAYVQTARELSRQYVLAYVARSGASSRTPRVEVRVPSHPGAIARAQVGYVTRPASGR